MAEVPAAQAAEAAGQQSPLLRCLSQLNDDVLTAHLLPKLVEQGSAGAVVLTCSQLRRLLQPSIQHLDLTKQLQDTDNPCHSPELARQLVAAFPNCTSLDFAWASSSMANVYRSISPLLAGLPYLSTISIMLDADSQEGDLDPVLAVMLLHAKGLCCLSLHMGTSLWDHSVTWNYLGQIVNLTKLQLTFSDEESFPCNQDNLLSLRALSKLQSLCIVAPGSEQQDNYAGALAAHQFPGQLTSLTELQLPLEVVREISSVSACVNLRGLRFGDSCGIEHIQQWGAREWDALASLTQLTRLDVEVYLDNVSEATADAFHGVLRQLKGLCVVGAYGWLSGSLPVLQSLTHVTAVRGSWDVPPELNISRPVCPHIRELDGAFRRVPFRAFPNLTSLTLYWLPADVMCTLSCCCPSLQRLALAADVANIGMASGNTAACVSAMKSLAQLQHLTHLELSTGSDAQLMAFSGVRAALGAQQLRYLFVRGPLSLFALVQLQSVRGLNELSVHVTRTHPSFTAEGVRVWLVSLAVVPRVSLVLCSKEQCSVVEAARQWAAQLGLPLPVLLKVTCMDSLN